MRKIVLILAATLIVAACQSQPNDSKTVPNPVVSISSPTIVKTPEPNETNEVPDPIVTKSETFISYMRDNVNALDAVSDELLDNSGNFVCEELKSNKSTIDVLGYLTGEANMSSTTAAHLVYASTKFKCPEFTEKVKSEVYSRL